jgi:hypothetical protein
MRVFTIQLSIAICEIETRSQSLSWILGEENKITPSTPFGDFVNQEKDFAQTPWIVLFVSDHFVQFLWTVDND